MVRPVFGFIDIIYILAKQGLKGLVRGEWNDVPIKRLATIN
jgi:hypothetical protein